MLKERRLDQASPYTPPKNPTHPCGKESEVPREEVSAVQPLQRPHLILRVAFCSLAMVTARSSWLGSLLLVFR